MIPKKMPRDGYLKDRLWLYLPFFGAVLIVCAVILVLPYETVYVQDEAFLDMFLVTVSVCVAIFMFGTLYNILIWMLGKGLSGSAERRLVRVAWKSIKFFLSRRFGRAVSVFLKDGLYLSRLKERSALRWLMHILILGGFAIMFVLDLAVTVSLDFLKYEPMIQDDGWAKLWLRDFGFDLVGAMMLVGLLIAAFRRFVVKPKIVRTELPDAASILFLLAVVVGGFVLEGIGIAGNIQGHEIGDQYSFMGYAFSLITPDSLGAYYDEAWLIHGIMSALLIAYIPFSKLFHMIATPIAIEADRMLPQRGVAP
jgi:nitrate reductase gamma subunit